MYENGKQLNRYAALKRHKNKLKEKHTPVYYSSYSEYYRILKEKYPDEYTGNKNDDKWWKPCIRKYGNKSLKEEAKRCRGAYYKELCNEIMNCKDFDEFEGCIKESFGDPWNWD